MKTAIKTQQQTQVGNFKATRTPLHDLEQVAYPGQNPDHRRYRRGFETFFNMLYKMLSGDVFLWDKVLSNRQIMANLAQALRLDPYWTSPEMLPKAGEFIRTIIGMEKPVLQKDRTLKEGVEVLVASWGDGMTSPVHGHSAGFLYENILFGKMRVNTYQMLSPTSRTVRLIRTDIVGPGEFVANYEEAKPDNHFKRQTLIHNFTSIGQSASLHFVPEHTRDGRDNTFEVEYFDDRIKLTKDDVVQINAHDGLYLQPGDVALVRSTNVPEYGDHYIVVTGHPVVKAHGLRPQDVAMIAPTNTLLDQFEMKTGLILLKLKDHARNQYLNFHNIELEDKNVIFPKP